MTEAGWNGFATLAARGYSRGEARQSDELTVPARGGPGGWMQLSERHSNHRPSGHPLSREAGSGKPPSRYQAAGNCAARAVLRVSRSVPELSRAQTSRV